MMVLALSAGPALAAKVTVTDAWFRALPSGLPAGGYFTLHNGGATGLAVTGAHSQSCGTLMLHQSTDMGGMSGMDMVEKVPLPAGGTVRFAPGGYHLMCEQPKMKPGGKAAVVITLSDGTGVAATFAVRDARGR